MTPVPDVVVLVVTWNSADTISGCLRSVEQAGRNVRVQTVVADNGSRDGTAEKIARDFPGVGLLHLDGGVGFAEANNVALSHADLRARYVLLLNPDAMFRPRCLEALVGWMDGVERTAGGCGPLLINLDGTLQPSWGRFPTLWSEWSGRIRRTDAQGKNISLSLPRLRKWTGTRSTDWLGGACLLLRREAITALGGLLLDPLFPLYSEEVDLCLRLRAAGWGIYLVPQAECIHAGGASSSQVRGQALGLLLTSKVRLFQKHRPHQARVLKWGLIALAGSKSILLRGERGKAYREAWHILRHMEG